MIKQLALTTSLLCALASPTLAGTRIISDENGNNYVVRQDDSRVTVIGPDGVDTYIRGGSDNMTLHGPNGTIRSQSLSDD